MFTVDELAKHLKISRGTVVNLIKKGEIKAIKIGEQYRIPEENFNSFITASEVTTFTNAGGKIIR